MSEEICKTCSCELQEKDGQLRRLRVNLKAAEERLVMDKVEAAASPLDAAQRSVIRNLGLKVSSFSQQVASLKEERDLAQVSILENSLACSLSLQIAFDTLFPESLPNTDDIHAEV